MRAPLSAAVPVAATRNAAHKGAVAAVYVFCVLNHKVQGSINPMDVSQWDFYLTKTSILDEKLGNQKTITLSSLKNLNPKASTFRNLRNNFERQFA